MSHEEKIKYMKIAGNIVGYSFPEEALDMLVSVYELVVEKKGETDLDSICSIKIAVNEREEIRNTKVKEQICYKTNEVCKYDCGGICKESC